jgi:hypothetical protein
MNDSPKLFVSSYRCFDCGSEIGFRSRRRTFAERFLLPVFLLQPVRCGECFRRDYRLIFTPVHERLSDASNLAVPKIMPTKQRPAAGRNVA